MGRDFRATLSAASLAAVNIFKVASQAVAVPVVASFVGPKAYGQIAFIMPFIYLSLLLSEAGLGACLVRAQSPTKELQGTVFTFSLLVSVVLASCVSILGYSLEGTFLEAGIAGPMALSSLIIVLSAFLIVPSAILLREQAYSALALSDVISTCIGLVTVGAGIFFSWGVWSIVFQQIAIYTSKCLVVSVSARSRPHAYINMKLLLSNLHFGTHLTGASFFNFIARSTDNVLVGGLLGTEKLAFYAMAYQIASMPAQILSGAAYFTIFSRTSEASRLQLPINQPFISINRVILLVAAPAAGGAAVIADVLITSLLGSKWSPTSSIIHFLWPIGIAQVVSTSLAGLFTGSGRSDLVFKVSLFNVISIMVGISLGFFWGVEAVAFGISFASIMTVAYGVRSAKQNGYIDNVQIYRSIFQPLIPAGVSLLIVLLTKVFFVDDSRDVRALSFLVCEGAILYLTCLVLVFRSLFSAEVEFIRDFIRSAAAKLRVSIGTV